MESKSSLSKIRANKTKLEVPTVASIEVLFEEYNISPAAYHGGKLNGVDCREVMGKASELFQGIVPILLEVQHDDRASAEVIESVSKLHRDLCVTLDSISSKMRMKHGAPKESDYEILERSLMNLDFLWRQAGISFTPKIHGILCHAFQQMKRLGGFGDLLEDDLEHLHQMSKAISDRTSRIKNKQQQAFSHSKIEAKLNNKDIKAVIQQVEVETKRVLKKRPLDSISKSDMAKIERDSNRMDTLVEV
jgi:hypothetical protein